MMASRYLPDFDSIIDVGCGANLRYDMELSNLGKRVYGVDFALNFLLLAGRGTGIPLAQGEATQLPYKNESFDAAICSETIEHVADEAKVISEIARVLRPGGLLFITAPNLWNAHRLIESIKHWDFAVHLMEGHLREYTRARLRAILVPYFEVLSQSPVRFGWNGRFGSKIDLLIRAGILRSLSKSVALVARKAVFQEGVSVHP